MQTQSLDIPLHDIKPLVAVSDNSFILFVGLIVAALLFLAGVSYLLYLFVTRRKEENRRKDAYKILKKMQFDNAKQAAYAITKYGYLFADDTPRNREVYDNLLTRLAPYKYKKEVDAIDAETLSYFKIYLGMIDV